MGLAAELKWLKDHPEFEERPATIREFIGPDYLNIEKGMRKAVMRELEQMFGNNVDGKRMTRVRRAIFTGAIGIGKTTVASIVLPYMAHWCLCLKDPQDFFELLPGSRIAFMMMSTSETQAKQVLFGDIDARIKYSKWFREKYPKDPTFKNQIRFDKDIWIVPGDSAETTFEGYNILGGIIDEADSHKVTQEKDYAETGYTTIDARIDSRFQERGFLLVVGQMKKSVGFAARRYNDFKNDADAYAARLSIWESLGWERWIDKKTGKRDSFWYDTKRKQIVPSPLVGVITNSSLIEIPNTYLKVFETNPEKSLRDLAGIPPAVGDPFISLVHRIEECVERWRANVGDESPVGTAVTRPQFAEWFRARDSLKRAIHIDLAYSAQGDALGLAMGHVREVVDIDGEHKPYIVFDFLLRIKAAPGTEIMLSEVRHIIYYLRDELKYNIKMVTLDGFQSTDTMQQLNKRRFWADYVSVDKQLLPYYDLREAIYEERVEFPPYFTYINPGDDQKVEIAVKELTELVDNGKKIDHPEGGSKDVTDAMAGVTYTLMGDRSFRKKVTHMGDFASRRQQATGTEGYGGLSHPAMGNLTGLSAPIPPTGANWTRR